MNRTLSKTTEVVIALGSNLGKRCRHLETALKKMEENGIKIFRHSCLYETSPVGKTDQPNFLNAGVLGTTEKDPFALLHQLKHIEKQMGRDLEGERWGPRTIDLDVIFCGEHHINDPILTIPHPRWKERDFVKAPLLDLAHSYFSVQTEAASNVEARFTEVKSIPIGESNETISRVTHLGNERFVTFGRKTWIMQILNITPDSFSDGGAFLSENKELRLSNIVNVAKKAVSCGVQILDVGGQSTRPKATLISEDDEKARILPVIRELRKAFDGTFPLISVDTFYASVAKAAIQAGADLINDVSGGMRDPGMFSTIAELEVPCVLMHMRGTPKTMLDFENVSYSSDPISDIGKELQIRSEKAMEAGIPPWRQILDPGIGFAKTAETSFEILRDLKRFRKEIFRGSVAHLPLLIGLSRKRFLSHFTGRDVATERDWVSKAMEMDAVRNGADIIRTHDSETASEVLSVADALYRTCRLPNLKKSS